MSEKSNIEEGIKILFQRPNEPSFTKKNNGKAIFELPLDFYSERYKNIGQFLSSRLGEDVERTIQLRAIEHPNLDFTKVNNKSIDLIYFKIEKSLLCILNILNFISFLGDQNPWYILAF